MRRIESVERSGAVSYEDENRSDGKGQSPREHSPAGSVLTYFLGGGRRDAAEQQNDGSQHQRLHGEESCVRTVAVLPAAALFIAFLSVLEWP